MLTILVTNIHASYGILLSQAFCKNLGGEVKLDWLQATIPISSKKAVLNPEPKAKHTIFPSEDPKSHILYQEIKFANYFILLEE